MDNFEDNYGDFGMLVSWEVHDIVTLDFTLNWVVFALGYEFTVDNPMPFANLKKN